MVAVMSARMGAAMALSSGESAIGVGGGVVWLVLRAARTEMLSGVGRLWGHGNGEGQTVDGPPCLAGGL
jgi:hypothetical protein